MDRFCKYILFHKYILEWTELVSQSLLKKGKLEGRRRGTPSSSHAKGKTLECKVSTQTTAMEPVPGCFPGEALLGCNVHTVGVRGISLPMRVVFCKDDWDNICCSACHLHHGIPRLEPRKPPRKLSHTFSRIDSAKKERGTVRRKTIWGKNLSAAQLVAMSETQGDNSQVTEPGTEGSHPRKHHQVPRKDLD